MSTLLRPDTITIERKSPIVRSATGDEQPGAVQSIAANMPALVLNAGMSLRGSLTMNVEGETMQSTHTLIVDGVPTSAVPSGTAPGGAFTYNGLPYVLAKNGRAGVVDLRTGDRVTDQDGSQYLVMIAQPYYDVKPNTQAELAFGRAWQ